MIFQTPLCSESLWVVVALFIDRCMTNKEEYRQLCERETTIPLFSQAWWYDAACVKHDWDVLLSRGKDGRVEASLPYMIGRKLCFRYVCLPQYTQNSGVWIRPQMFCSQRDKLLFETSVCNEIIDGLEALNLLFFVQSFHFSFSNWLPFYWRGYKQTTRYTYRIPDLSDLDRLFLSFAEAKRRHIRKAERRLVADVTLKADEFVDFCQMVYRKRGERFEGSRDVIISLIDAARFRKQGEVISIRDSSGTIHSALFVVWDSASAYYLIPATDPDFKSSGASSLIVWEAIKLVSTETASFDFEGSMIQSIENSYNQYGTIQTPYFTLWKQKIPILKL